MNRRRNLLPLILLTASFLLADCTIPSIRDLRDSTPTPTIVQTNTPDAQTALTTIPVTPTPLPPVPIAELGLAENPLILALPPAANTQEQVTAAQQIAAQITERTGYTVVTIVPETYTDLLTALANGNADIVLLEPYAYELAYRQDLVRASYAVIRDGEGKYGAQFIAARGSGFESYFNPLNETNIISDARIAITQLANKKPCWSDETSASGYVIPLGYLNMYQLNTRPAAFVGGHPTVVRSLYATGICDFGATYVDARKFPSLEDEYPDLVEQVVVIWRIPKIIPHEVLAFSTRMSQEMRDQISAIIPAILQTEAGEAAFKTAYDIDEIEPVNDGYYEEFRIYLDESRVDLTTLVK
ncbi:MAG TPA: PhnD/SsuA/transferrin family substrate-binding protein [Anaerolineales bacterium]|nr:PhnD/SsuA/transferrin family substrate-binding protein [Anaerolineales bacterium]